jgi:hypothetical protein
MHKRSCRWQHGQNYAVDRVSVGGMCSAWMLRPSLAARSRSLPSMIECMW